MDNKKKIIGVCGARLFNQIPMQFINTLKKQSEKEGYFIIAFSSNSDDEEETDGYVGESQLYELAKYIDENKLSVDIEKVFNGTGCILLHHHEMSQILQEKDGNRLYMLLRRGNFSGMYLVCD